ncbi:MAG: hypothetical protein ACKO96_40135 [Flammeovirgaceae bacterium]
MPYNAVISICAITSLMPLWEIYRGKNIQLSTAVNYSGYILFFQALGCAFFCCITWIKVLSPIEGAKALVRMRPLFSSCYFWSVCKSTLSKRISSLSIGLCFVLISLPYSNSSNDYFLLQLLPLAVTPIFFYRLIMEIKIIRKNRLSQISKWVYLTYLTNFAAALSTIFLSKFNFTCLVAWGLQIPSNIYLTLAVKDSIDVIDL